MRDTTMHLVWAGLLDRIEEHGEYGGPLVGIYAVYEDGTKRDVGKRLLARIEALEALAGPDAVRAFDGQVEARMKLLARIEELEAREPEDSPEWAEEHRARVIAETKVEALTLAGDGLAECVIPYRSNTTRLAAWEKAKVEIREGAC